MSDNEDKRVEETGFENRPDFQVNTGDFFSSIPVLKAEGKQDHFSFEKFDKSDDDDEPSEEGLDSFSAMLLNKEDESEETLIGSSTQDIISKNREKWEKRVQDRGKKKLSKTFIILLVLVPLILIGAGAVGLYFSVFSESPLVEGADSGGSANNHKHTGNTDKVAAGNGASATGNEDHTTESGGSGKKPDAAVQSPTPEQTEEQKQAAAEEAKRKAREEAKQAKLLEKRQYIEDIESMIDGKNTDVISDEVLKFLKQYPGDLDSQLKILRRLITVKKIGIARTVYSEWVEENPNSQVANYLKAMVTDDDATAEDYLKKVVDGPRFIKDAYLRLAGIYLHDKDWRDAEKVYWKYLKHEPLNREICAKLLALKIRRKDLANGLKQVSLLLLENGVSRDDVAARLIKYALKLENPKMAEDFLLDLKSSSNHADDYQINKIRFKATYGKLSEDDFSGGFYPSKVREFHLMYLIANGRDSEVARVPTPPKDFPDFWKVYLAWRKGWRMWRDLADKLKKRYANSNSFVPIIVDVWRGRIKDSEAKAKLSQLSSEEKPILLFLLAEYNRRKHRKIKASVLYTKACRYKVTPYRYLIKSFSDKY